jgi:hypothetical protein
LAVHPTGRVIYLLVTPKVRKAEELTASRGTESQVTQRDASCRNSSSDLKMNTHLREYVEAVGTVFRPPAKLTNTANMVS